MEEAWIKPVDLTETSESLPPVAERFLRYAAVDTQSDETSRGCPSTPGQWTLAWMLERELTAMGASQVRVSDHGYVYAKIPANVETADGGKNASRRWASSRTWTPPTPCPAQVYALSWCGRMTEGTSRCRRMQP